MAHERSGEDPVGPAGDRDPSGAAGSTSAVLDEALDRMARSDFELPNGFVNHGPMACEALAVLGCDDRIDGWARRSVAATGEGPTPVPPSGGPLEWPAELGRYERLPEWIGYFEAVVAVDGWPAVVATWVPRLMPALPTALFHGAIRTAHAVRAVAATDTPARRAELARALGYWAARYRPGAEPGDPDRAHPDGTDLARAVTAAAADAGHWYLAEPDIFHLHGVTGAMAVELLAPHLAPEDAVAALAQVRADHSSLFAGSGRGRARPGADWDPVVVDLVAASGDPHQVKLVEACRRGLALSGDPVFVTAADVVAGRS